MATRETVSKALAMLSIAFQEKKTSEEFYALYQEMLVDISDEDLIKSAKECLVTCRFFPTIAELRDRAIKSENDGELSKMFFRLIDDYADNKSIDYKTRSIKSALDAVGGLRALTKMTNKDLQFIRKDFIAYAKDYQRAENLNLLPAATGNLIEPARPYIP